MCSCGWLSLCTRASCWLDCHSGLSLTETSDRSGWLLSLWLFDAAATDGKLEENTCKLVNILAPASMPARDSTLLWAACKAARRAVFVMRS